MQKEDASLLLVSLAKRSVKKTYFKFKKITNHKKASFLLDFNSIYYYSA